MRTVTWLLVFLAIAAIAQAEPGTGTVVVSCNEADASLLVDGVLLPERTPAVLTLPTGTHTIEARKPSLVSDKKIIQVTDQQTVKVRLDLLPPAPPPPLPGTEPAGSGAGSATGSAAGSASGSGAGSASGSAAPVPIVLPASAPSSRCTEGGHEVACVQGPHCTEGGKAVPCKKGEKLPPALAPQQQPPAAVTGITAGSGAGSAAREPAPAVTPGAAALEIATTVPHAIVYVDGAPVRDAPCVLEIEPGEHVVGVVAAGMVPAETLVRIAAAQRQRIELSPTTPRRRIDDPAH